MKQTIARKNNVFNTLLCFIFLNIKKMSISKQTLETVYTLITKNNVEMCGNLLQLSDLKNYGIQEIKDDGLFLYVEKTGDQSSCQNDTYTKYTWHTHSHKSKGYPSVADLFVPLRKIPDTSFVFTIWGIWELHAGKKYAVELTKDRREYIKEKYLDKILEKIYSNTDHGRASPLSDKQKSAVIQLTNSLNKVMNDILGFKFQAKFTDWRDINGDYFVEFS